MGDACGNFGPCTYSIKLSDRVEVDGEEYILGPNSERVREGWLDT